MQGGRETDTTPLAQRHGTTDIENPYTPATQQPSQEQASQVKDQAKDAAGQAQEKVKAAGEKAQETANKGVDKAAEGMESAASKLRESVGEQGGMAAEAGTRVADTMDKTATYLRDHDTTQMMDDIEAYVKEHPMQALAGALVGGFVLARILR